MHGNTMQCAANVCIIGQLPLSRLYEFATDCVAL